MNCPINEQTADGHPVGRCWFYLPDGKTCPRHGNVEPEVEHFNQTGKTTPERVWRERIGAIPVAIVQLSRTIKA